MTVLKYIREGILVFLYYLIRCAIGVVNLMVLVYNLFQFKRTSQKSENEKAIA
jgi:hypothetical protein